MDYMDYKIKYTHINIDKARSDKSKNPSIATLA